MGHKTRLILADNDRLLAEACRHLLEPEFDVVAIADNGRDLVEVALRLRPQAIILDVSLPQLNGLDAGEQIKRKLPTLVLLFLSGSAQPGVAAEAFRRGASGYLLKRSGWDEFLTGIRSVMRGESFLSPRIARETIDYLIYRPSQETSYRQVTQRESEILQLLVEGRSMKQVARLLGISHSTVAFHKYKVMQRLGIGSNAELLQFALSKFIAPARGDWATVVCAEQEASAMADVPKIKTA